ncbi:DUF4209 domain-containing protein [Frigoribacterium sp. VKM Ac-2530]|uniref:DUF4209 domain-containing protein n=1 Tax=Frigoribacterium sp. VKM Ac-2530 TaxID=2783822 RepID=UPI00188C7E3B|nr:DUF4209 domain-containing protein [Frigoribacterium sp. VKM Ac-2530]MBF4579622.1 DUF4209 domain-containing protein [Frigoribacterium sp. VKM Ac-2530]
MNDAQKTPADRSAAWIRALKELEVGGAFRDEPSEDEERLPSLWSRLSNAESGSNDQDVDRLRTLLAHVASFMCRPDDLSQPYEPMLNMREGRSAVPSDLSDDEIEILTDLASLVPDLILRARICDVIAIRSSGGERVGWFNHELAALSELDLVRVSRRQDQVILDRGLRVGLRYGKPLQDGVRTLEALVIEHALTADVTDFPGWGADLLLKHGLARTRASGIAARMHDIGTDPELVDPEQARAYLDRAAEWYSKAGQKGRADEERFAVVQSLMSEAETLAVSPGSNSAPKSGYLYERALKELRRIPRSRREALGAGDLTQEIASRIRTAGAAALGSMGVFQSESADLGDLRRTSIEAVSNKSPLEALRAFTGLTPIASLAHDRQFAQELIQKHPLQSLFSNVHYSHDGRVVHRSAGQGGEPIYGEDPSIWRQLVQGYEFRIGLEVQAYLAPAWLTLTNEHTLSVGDFLQVTHGSSIVPADREMLYAQALLYGFNGDFATAAQLLTPQLEHLVRTHFRNAGQATTTIDGQGIENEVGLSALMAREIAADILGDDIAYAIRAFFCGPIGPNLRNEIAHGLVNDSWVNSAQSLHCWWFMLRLTFIPYWNRIHDAQAVDEQEPAERAQAESGN